MTPKKTNRKVWLEMYKVMRVTAKKMNHKMSIRVHLFMVGRIIWPRV